MICLNGDPEHLELVPELQALGLGVELQSYGLIGIKSPEEWNRRFACHSEFLKHFHGPLAVHGPFIGMDFNPLDRLISEAIDRRMDMIHEVVKKLQIGTLVLHTGYPLEAEVFNENARWMEKTASYWSREIRRWEELGVSVVLENVMERSPELMIALADRVNSRALGLCLDTGHVNVVSTMPLPEWVARMGARLRHVHVHDNDGHKDAHLLMGQGTIDFPAFFRALKQHAPAATVSIETFGDARGRLENLKAVMGRG
jgi:sugar phosphate isomerase/epimerase